MPGKNRWARPRRCHTDRYGSAGRLWLHWGTVAARPPTARAGDGPDGGGAWLEDRRAFHGPAVTTEGIPIRTTPDIELRVGPQPGENFDVHAWERSAERIPAADIHVANGSASALVDATRYYGKTVLIGVRVHGPHGRDIGWSHFETLPLVQALPTPEGLEAKDGPDSVQLDWHAAAPLFRIYRKMPADADWAQIGTSAKPSYADTTIEYGKTYRYFVQAIEKTGEKYAESEDSAIVAWTPVDKFPPAAPTGLTAVPGTRTIELVWERNTERDFASYRVYRDGKRIAEMVGSPAFSDKDVTAGTSYRYQVERGRYRRQ